MNFTDTLDHFCIKGARLNVHNPPETVSCGNADCGQGEQGEHKLHFTHETAQKLGIDLNDPKCPACGGDMLHSGPRHFGELHLEVCLDARLHYPEWRRSGKISQEEYDAWQKTLTERELQGYFEHHAHHMMVRLDPHEVELFEQQPEALVAALMPKIEARLELDAQFQIQHRYKTKQHNVLQHFKHIKGGKLGG